jgi:hypothetical protein
MSNTDPGQEQAELSFRELKMAINYCRAFIRMGLLKSRRAIKSNFIILLALFILIMGYGFYRYVTRQALFQGTASYVYTVLHKKVYGEMTDKLEQAIQSGSYSLASEKLDIPIAQLRSVCHIAAKNIYGSKLSEDITDEKVPFYISITATNDSIFAKLQPAIENYFNNNPLALQRTQQQKIALQQKITYTELQLKWMDSLKAAYTESLNNPDVQHYGVLGQGFNPVDLYQKSEEMNAQLANMKGELQDIKSVKLLNGFMVGDKPQKISSVKFLLPYFMVFMICSFLTLISISIFKK